MSLRTAYEEEDEADDEEEDAAEAAERAAAAARKAAGAPKPLDQVSFLSNLLLCAPPWFLLPRGSVVPPPLCMERAWTAPYGCLDPL